MSNSYTKTSFEMTGVPAELDVLQEAFQIATSVANSDGDEYIEAIVPSAGFLAAFPVTEATEFFPNLGGFLDRFDDAAEPSLSAILQRDSDTQVSIYGEEAPEIELIAELIRATNDCGRPVAGAYGGGYVLITKSGVEFENLDLLADAAPKRAQAEATFGAAADVIAGDTDQRSSRPSTSWSCSCPC